jgi:hypothetical protein
VTGQAVPVTQNGQDSGRDRPTGSGIVGLASLSRLLLAVGRTQAAATAIAASWLVVIVADVVLVAVAPARLVVPILAAAFALVPYRPDGSELRAAARGARRAVLR